MLKNIKVVLDGGAYMPERAHSTDAGADLRTPKEFVIAGRGSAIIDTGVHMMIPKGYAGRLESKSGLNVKQNIRGEGLIDAFYVGSIVVKLYNDGDMPVKFLKGDKIIQITIQKVETPGFVQVDSLEKTERGSNGFGSTGR